MLAMPHDWFANLTGFREEGYDLTRSRLRVEDTELVSTVNDKRYGVGEPVAADVGRIAPGSRFPRDT